MVTLNWAWYGYIWLHWIESVLCVAKKCQLEGMSWGSPQIQNSSIIWYSKIIPKSFQNYSKTCFTRKGKRYLINLTKSWRHYSRSIAWAPLCLWQWPILQIIMATELMMATNGDDDDSRRVRGRLLGSRPALSVNLGLPTVRSLYVAFRFFLDIHIFLSEKCYFLTFFCPNGEKLVCGILFLSGHSHFSFLKML